MTNIIEVLQERGFIDTLSSEELPTLSNKPLRVYCGFDPTGDSLHIGHMVALMGLAWFQKFGHKPYAIIGGATGMIGDPSGKASERQLLSEEIIDQNIKGIRKNLETILDFSNAAAKPEILNNLDWFKEFSYIGFLRDVGKFFRIGPMLAKESVKLRMESEEGMSYTEFSYQLLQGYDFLHLFDTYGVTVQLGGSYQWGNITAGTELVRKARGKTCYAITFPLMTRSDGQKFGKSEKGAVWLSPEKCSPYDFYQYLVRVADDEVLKLMRLITFMEMDEIRKYEAMMKQPDYVQNTAQRRLAEEVTRLVHGEEGLATALKVTQAAAPGANAVLDANTLESISQDLPGLVLPQGDVVGHKLIDLIVQAGLQPSKGEARRLIKNGGVYVNNEKVSDENMNIELHHLVDSRLILLAAGKKNKVLIRIAK